MGMQVSYCFYSEISENIIYDKIRMVIGEILRDLSRQKDVTLLEGHAMADHIHMCVSIPPKFSVAMVVGYLKGKSAIIIHKEMGGNRTFTGKHFWSRGYCESIVGLDEEMIQSISRISKN